MRTLIREKIQTYSFKTLFALCLLVFPLLLTAQDEASPLIAKLQTVKGNAKIDLLNQISVVYRKTDRFKSLDFAWQAYILSVENNYLPGKALAKKNEGICWFFMGNNDSARRCYKEALVVYTNIRDQKGISACYNNLGLISQETGKYNDALNYYQLSVNIDQKLGDAVGVALTLQNMADIHIYLGDVKNAMKLTNQCLRIYTQQSDKSGIMTSYGNRGAEYDYLHLFNESARDYMEALRMARQLKDKYIEIMVTSNIGVMYWHWKKPDIAMQYLTSALEMSDETDDAYDVNNALKTMAEIYTSQKHYALANEIYQKILNRTVEIDNKRQVAVIMTAIGRNLIELNEIDKALGYLNKSLEITVGLNTPYELLENYRNLVYVNSILHNFKAADSLQDLFAQTYSDLATRDSTNVLEKRKLKNQETSQPSMSGTSKWVIAFLLLIVVVLMSVSAYRKEAS